MPLDDDEDDDDEDDDDDDEEEEEDKEDEDDEEREELLEVSVALSIVFVAAYAKLVSVTGGRNGDVTANGEAV